MLRGIARGGEEAEAVEPQRGVVVDQERGVVVDEGVDEEDVVVGVVAAAAEEDTAKAKDNRKRSTIGHPSL